MTKLLQFADPASHISMLIDNLGHSPEQVAEELRMRGIRGVRHAVRYLNPLVRYLQAGFQAEFGTKVFMDVIKGDVVRIVLLNGEKKEVSLSNATFLFMNAFDRGEFPDLEEEPQYCP